MLFAVAAMTTRLSASEVGALSVCDGGLSERRILQRRFPSGSNDESAFRSRTYSVLSMATVVSSRPPQPLTSWSQRTLPSCISMMRQSLGSAVTTDPLGYASALGADVGAGVSPDAMLLPVGVVSSAPAPGGGERSEHAMLRS